jgi:DNA-binding protein YbaB
MADFSKIFEQAQQMQARMQEMQAELEKQTVTASTGGGLVTVEADGKGTITSFPSCLASGGRRRSG